MLPKIIVNADDFGMSKVINREIIEFINLGLISSTTLLMNGPEIDEALSFSRKCNSISFGVHLNLTEFYPLTFAAKKSHLCDSEGKFQDLYNLKMTYNDFSVICDEWSAQVERCLASGIRISHFDSHHHVHTRPETFFALKYVMNKYKINKVRITRNLIPENSQESGVFNFKIFKKNYWNFSLRNLPPKAKCVDFFGSLSDLSSIVYGEYPSIENNSNDDFLKKFNNRVLEIMCHPGGTGSNFLFENKLLKEGIKNIYPTDFKLITYHDL